MFSSPLLILMLSTTVSIDGNVLSTRFDSNPGSNGVYCFGSNVSVCAIPPAIHRTMTVSHVGLIASFGSSTAQSGRGSPAASAASVAALAVFKKSRRDQFGFMYRIVSPNQLKLRQHDEDP